MLFIETPVFTEEVLGLLEDEEYRELQSVLVLRPEQGDLISGTGGLRKIRWGAKGKGKRGGCRIIYYLDKHSEIVYMLMVFAKNVQVDLTSRQAKILSKLVREEFK